MIGTVGMFDRCCWSLDLVYSFVHLFVGSLIFSFSLNQYKSTYKVNVVKRTR